jgi:MOSC domain-containing protein YiiM
MQVAAQQPAIPGPRIVSLNIGTPKTIEGNGGHAVSAIVKEPVSGRLRVRGVNIDGDDQADRNAHGGPVRAIYAYAAEDYAWWEAELGRRMAPGTFGENLTTLGLDVNEARVGEQWRIGSALLQVTIPRVPCFKLAMRMNDKAFVKTFAAALRPGPYFTIIEEGDFAQGDTIEIVHRPANDLSVREVFRIYLFDRGHLEDLLVPELPDTWRTWIHEQVHAEKP